MLRMKGIGIVLGDTSRSRVYLQALTARGLAAEHAYLLPGGAARPGHMTSLELDVHEVSFGTVDMSLRTEDLLRAQEIPVSVLPSGDINDSGVVAMLAHGTQDVMIYSGFGGVILREDVLGCGKQFLHVHGGYLPDYKGSTTNYFSYLMDGSCGASSMFMSEKIDSGTVLVRERFMPQGSLRHVDHVLDSCFRAEVLCRTLILYLEQGSWPEAGSMGEGRVYYIMHPLLRHVAVCSSIKDRNA